MAFQSSFSIGGPSNAESSQQNLPPNITVMAPWMEVPPSMPWSIENPPQLVRFGEATADTDPWNIPRPKLKFYKRKCDLDFNPKPAKMHITEEKMAAQFKDMHISNSYMGQQGFGEDGPSNCLLPTLVLSKEVQNLPTFQEPFIPESLLTKPEKPTRALVVWKPPSGSLTAQLIAELRNSKETDEDKGVNNNTSTPDLNSMTTSVSDSGSTAMEL